jgi:hypothetical protein
MKLKDIKNYDVRQLMGSDATNREASMMKDILGQFEDKYLDTKDIPDALWGDMMNLAIDQANSS